MTFLRNFQNLKRCCHTVKEQSVKKNFPWTIPDGNKTNIVVYNPIIKCKTPLIVKNNTLTWYMCGPTVYDSSHIGHACTYVKFDIIRRILSEFFDLNVVQIMGLTDIDDKIIQRANESGQNWKNLTKKYENEFFSDMELLNVLKPFKTCRVTDYIPQIISFIKKILDKNGGYIAKDGSVYFDTLKYPHYGKLDLPQDEEPHPYKKSSLDFALWKATKENEPFWESPWGNGRPGWHIECSAIASLFLGNNIDIHSGGIDLAFPHHENEEAQSCCYHNTDQWINYWLHTGHLHLPGDTKMSKSLQNTISISSLLKTLTANEFRMLCLFSQYRNNVVFSEKMIKNSQHMLKKIEFFISDCEDYVSGRRDASIDEANLFENLENTKNKVISALADDFNTPKAMHLIHDLLSVGNKMMQHEKKNLTEARCVKSVAAVSNYLQSLFIKLGISKTDQEKKPDEILNFLEVLVEFRAQIRNRALETKIKDAELLKACDDVRKNLSSIGVDIRDFTGGKSSWTIRKK